MQKFIFILGFLTFSLVSFGQTLKDWEGHYYGSIKVMNLEGKNANYHMELIIGPEKDSSRAWTIIYGEDSTRQVRDYTLKYTPTQNLFDLDEHNGIILQMTLVDRTMYSVFMISNKLISVSYQLTENGIIYSLENVVKTTSTGEGTEESPTVENYAVNLTQTTVLKKK